MLLDKKSILVTGATGSFGKRFVEMVLKRYPGLRRLIVFSRDELKQFEMRQIFPEEKYPQMRYFLGDVRDRDRLLRAFEGVDVVIHAAALKQVPAAEYNPMEFIKTNVIGAENVVECCIDAGVSDVVALSTDKACAPVNLYGASKLCSDKIFVAANNYVGSHRTKFSVVRYGNVMGSRGSVIPYFLARAGEETLPITDPRMTRFNITLDEGVEMVLFALENALGGEIFVPKIPSYRIVDVAEAIAPEAGHRVVGIRPGEKIHEEMITDADAPMTVDLGSYFVVLPAGNERLLNRYVSERSGTLVPEGFRYNSGQNDRFLTIPEIRSLVRDCVDPSFPHS